MNEEYKKYNERLSNEVDSIYDFAVQARKKGFDVEERVEIGVAENLSDRTEILMKLPGLSKRFQEIFFEEQSREKTIKRIFEEILTGKFGDIENREKRLETAIKTGLMLRTEGVVTSPLDGIPFVKIGKNFDGTEYVDIYFGGPIRSAGGTDAAFPLILGDYARKFLNLDVFKATDEEIERYVEEINIFQEMVSRQRPLKDDEIRHLVKHCPVCINGIPTEEREVSIHKDLKRVPTNKIRGGITLVMSEGLGLKAPKLIKIAKEYGLDWTWLEKMIKVSKSGERVQIKEGWEYLEKLAAGRPIFAYPLRFGGFRIRYGKGRNTGLMARGLNPCTMYVLNEFIGVGTQLKIELPGKSTCVLPVEEIEGPIVLLKNGEVKQINDLEIAKTIYPEIKEILFLGDILVTYGDFRKTGHVLVPAGYNEDWWYQELKKKEIETGENFGIDWNGRFNVSEEKALELAEKGLALHPKYLAYYRGMSLDDLKCLLEKAKNAELVLERKEALLPYDSNLKEILEKIGKPHYVFGEKIAIRDGISFLKTLGVFNENKQEIDKSKDVLQNLNLISGMIIRDKAGFMIGGRMGRPETAKPREMQPNVNVLFPVGNAGGATRSINKASNEMNNKTYSLGEIEVEINLNKCPVCKKISPEYYCRECGKRMVALEYEKDEKGRINKEAMINIKHLFDSALRRLQEPTPKIVKGVQGVFNTNKFAEPLEKGILRAKHDIFIFRDGTSRFEMLNCPLTHIKPKEIGLSLEKAKELGYEKDIYGNVLESEEQILQMFPQDFVVNESAGEYFVRVSQFIDDLLEKFYGMPRFYNLKSKEELIGHLIARIAPHTCSGVVGRVIGYTKARVGYCHPFALAASRRNSDGEQDSYFLLLDGLLNFSENYLANKAGGKQDAPLALTKIIRVDEIDDEAWEMECTSEYPLELYEKSLNFESPYSVNIAVVKNYLGKGDEFENIKFSHGVSDIALGPTSTRYVQIKSMEEKMALQSELQAKIRAVDTKDSIERVIASHFFPDIIGNARAFSRQTFRCTKCNLVYRRPPLKGTCKCGGNLILTIPEGGVKKYIEIAKKFIENYDLREYMKQRITLVEEEVNSLFAFTEEKKQLSLKKFL